MIDLETGTVVGLNTMAGPMNAENYAVPIHTVLSDYARFLKGYSGVRERGSIVSNFSITSIVALIKLGVGSRLLEAYPFTMYTGKVIVVPESDHVFRSGDFVMAVLVKDDREVEFELGGNIDLL